MVSMTKLIASAIFAIVVGSTAASAQSACGTGKLVFNGDDATGIEVPTGCPGMSANHMFRGIRNACPHGFVKFESTRVTSATGGRMTQEQKSRGDTRSHIVCDWDRARSSEAQATQPAPQSQPVAPPAAEAQPRPREQSAPRVEQYDPNRPILTRMRYVGEGKI